MFGTHGVELLPEPLRVLAVLQLGSTLVPLGLAEGLAEPLHLGAQLPRIPLQVAHLALPLGLAALQLQPQLMPALLQLLHGGGKIDVDYFTLIQLELLMRKL